MNTRCTHPVWWTRAAVVLSGLLLNGCELEPNPSPTSEPTFGGGATDGPGENGGAGGWDVSEPSTSTDGTDWSGADDAAGSLDDAGKDDDMDAVGGVDAVLPDSVAPDTAVPDTLNEDALAADTVAADAGGADSTDWDGALAGKCELICPEACTLTTATSSATSVAPALGAAVALTGWHLTDDSAIPSNCPAGTPLVSLMGATSADDVRATLSQIAGKLTLAWATEPTIAATRLWPLLPLACVPSDADCDATVARPREQTLACAEVAAAPLPNVCAATPCDAAIAPRVNLPFPFVKGAVVGIDHATIVRQGGTFTICGTVNPVATGLALVGGCWTTGWDLASSCASAFTAWADQGATCPVVNGQPACTVALTATEIPLASITWPEPTP